MQLEKGDPRQTLSRRMQDFHEADPATQAAINGEEYFEVTAGHLLSGALEADCFDTVEECLDFFGLEREVLKRSEPFTDGEINDFARRIYTEADERLRTGEEASYEHWAEWVIETSTMTAEEAEMAVNDLLESVVSNTPEASAENYAEELEVARFNSNRAYHADLLRMQFTRLIDLLTRDGFAITVNNAAKSFIRSGLLSGEDDEYTRKWEVAKLKQKLAFAAYHSQRREIQDGALDLSAFDEEDWEYRFEDLDQEDFAAWAEEGHAIVLSQKDLRLFASHYAAPDHFHDRGEEDTLISQDPRYQKLMALIKNTPQHIKEVQAHIAFLRK